MSMSYLTGLITAQKDLMRNIPARVVAEYSKSDRFYGTVNGKLCFGYEECNQFEEAERTGAIALSRDHLSSFRSTGVLRRFDEISAIYILFNQSQDSKLMIS